MRLEKTLCEAIHALEDKFCMFRLKSNSWFLHIKCMHSSILRISRIRETNKEILKLEINSRFLQHEYREGKRRHENMRQERGVTAVQ